MLKIPSRHAPPLPIALGIKICVQVLYLVPGARLQMIMNKGIPFLNRWASGTGYRASVWPAHQVARFVSIHKSLHMTQDSMLASWIANRESQNWAGLIRRNLMVSVFGQCQTSHARSEVHPSWCFRWWICMWLSLVSQISPQVWVYVPILKAFTWNTCFYQRELIVKLKPRFGKRSVFWCGYRSDFIM